MFHSRSLCRRTLSARLRSLPALALLALPLALALAPARAAIPGDVSGDGVVSVKDATLLLRAVIQIVTLTPEQTTAADMAPRPGAGGRLYGDGSVNIADAIRLLQYIVGIVSPDDFAPVEPRLLYTLNAGQRCQGAGTVSRVDLPAWFSNAANAVALNAFGTGATPNHMVVSGGKGYITNSGDNTLQIVDLQTGQSEPPIDLGVATNPLQVAVLGDKAYVTLLISNEVAVVDLTTKTVVKRISTGVGPTGVLAAAGRIFVTNSAFTYDPVKMQSVYGQGTVSVINPATDEITRTINVTTNPQDMALDRQGRVHVVSTGNYGDIAGAITVIDAAQEQIVGSVPIGGTPGSLTITWQNKAYLSDSSYGVTSYDAKALKVLRDPAHAIPVTPYAWDVASDSRGRLYIEVISANKVLIYDTATDTQIGEIPVGPCPEALYVE